MRTQLNAIGKCFENEKKRKENEKIVLKITILCCMKIGCRHCFEAIFRLLFFFFFCHITHRPLAVRTVLYFKQKKKKKKISNIQIFDNRGSPTKQSSVFGSGKWVRDIKKKTIFTPPLNQRWWTKLLLF